MPIRLPSISSLISESVFVFKRFPLALISAFFATIAALYLTTLEYSDFEEQRAMYYFLMLCSLGLTLFISAQLFIEQSNFLIKTQLVLKGIIVIVLSLYYVYLRNCFTNVEIIRFVLYNIAFHLLVSYSAYIKVANTNGFWQLNKALFLRIFFAIIYSGTLYLGICLALLAIDELFGIDIKSKYYLRLWLVVFGIFNTWFFLAGIPKNIKELNESNDYPKGLKIFTQYVLLPLVTLYLLILYCYMAKILVTQNLPKGWVSYLVIGFSVPGILALLLVYPIRNVEGNTWIKVFSKWFYAAIYPLVIMLFVAIFTRINDYGITENRYFVIVIALWLAFISTSFLFIKSFNIKLIPLSLSLVALLTSFGPWGAFSVSERSQLKILEKSLTLNEVLINGKINKRHAPVSDSVAIQITSIMSYLDHSHGFKSIQPWFTQNIDTIIADSNRYGRVDDLMNLMDIPVKYSNYYDREDENGNVYFNCYLNDNYPVKVIKGYDYRVEFYAYAPNENDNYRDEKLILDSIKIDFKLSKDSVFLNIILNENRIKRINMSAFVKQLSLVSKRDGNSIAVTSEQMKYKIETDSLSLLFDFNNINGYRKKDNFKIDNVSGNCLLRFK